MANLIVSIRFYNYMILGYFLTICSIYLVLNIISFKAIRKYTHKITHIELKNVFRFSNTKPISLIVPAYNEGNTIIDSTKAFLQLEYPEFQIIVVNDGSKDDTLDKLITHFSMKKVHFGVIENLNTKPLRGVYMSSKYPSLIVLDKENGGKADAINAGINISKNPLICVVDADSILERDCLLKIAHPFMENENTIAVGGIVRIANGCKVKYGRVLEIGPPKSWLGKIQVVEYLRAFLFGRTGFDSLNAMLIISGAFGCFKREALIKVGGYKSDSLGEDMEIVVKMHEIIRKNNPKARITFVPDPICWTLVPENFPSLRSQRIRWQKGTVQSLGLHKKLFLNPKYGWVGLLAFPYFTIFEMFGPIIEFSGYVIVILSYLLRITDVSFVVVFFTAAVLYGIVLSILSVILEEMSFRKYPKGVHLFILFCASVLENLGYRQLLTWWRFQAMVEYLFGARSWGKIEKKGFTVL
ncbi:MAG TPA: glycosyl transferase [Candidatus Atribacteria bacterium]|uniref:Glycosyltransferase n=1 Tax=candidate division TA06 bacterium 34_109 TaxID=1635277 RepID=A0A101HZW4_UNCT6|nr:MAG: Glycosyltransferase [candidate division TA06 bacterium 34_109]HBY57915.1 glycosyl transferase [Candidatus Atribacteria bacterium]